MTTLREAAQQALEALKKNTKHLPLDFDYHFEALAALRAALAEPVQEPYAWMAVGGSIWRHKTSEDDVPLYIAPPQRKPLSLTDLQEALVYTNLVDRDAIDDPDNYDEGSSLAQIDALHRIIGGTNESA